MFCYVIFGKSDDNHTRKYFYHSSRNVEPGCTAIVPDKNIVKLAMVHSSFKDIPTDIQIKKRKIKDIISINSEYVESLTVRSYLLAMIDEYKDGNINKEEFGCVMENFVSSNKLNIADDSKLESIVQSDLPDACLFYIDEPDDAGIKELGFWKKLKDIEYILRYGHSFWDRPKNRFHRTKEDSIEYTDAYLKIELELERSIRAEIGEGGYRGFCYQYWWTKKRILRERFGIDWKSPADLDPSINFD